MQFTKYYEVSEDNRFGRIHYETLGEDDAKGFVKKYFEKTGQILKIVEVPR